jgi:hypothetical protein
MLSSSFFVINAAMSWIPFWWGDIVREAPNEQDLALLRERPTVLGIYDRIWYRRNGNQHSGSYN